MGSSLSQGLLSRFGCWRHSSLPTARGIFGALALSLPCLRVFCLVLVARGTALSPRLVGFVGALALSSLSQGLLARFGCTWHSSLPMARGIFGALALSSLS